MFIICSCSWLSSDIWKIKAVLLDPGYLQTIFIMIFLATQTAGMHIHGFGTASYFYRFLPHLQV